LSQQLTRIVLLSRGTPMNDVKNVAFQRGNLRLELMMPYFSTSGREASRIHP